MASGPLLTPTITLFNLSLITSCDDRQLMTLTACQSIYRLPETFHGQCVAVIVGGIYMAMYGIRIA